MSVAHREKKKDFSVVRAIHQFGPDQKPNTPVRLFLDDARNPPLNEKGWVVVRTVYEGMWFMYKYGGLVTEVSLDNDLGPDPQGIELLKWILDSHRWKPFHNLKRITVHTGNLPKGRMMMRLLRNSEFKVVRRFPSDRVYPRMSDDKRNISEYKH